MKNLLKYSLILFAFLSLSACGGDDEKNPWNIIPGPPVGVEIKYKVAATANMIGEISYRMGDGNTFFGQLNPDDPANWEKLMVALYQEMPQNAFLRVRCRNTTSENQTVTISLLRDNTVIATQSAIVPPADNDDEIEDDIIVTALNKIISE